MSLVVFLLLPFERLIVLIALLRVLSRLAAAWRGAVSAMYHMCPLVAVLPLYIVFIAIIRRRKRLNSFSNKEEGPSTLPGTW
ncbi:MAG: hypothetical protein M3283_13000, partial [Actinomycetota bacterium]|nr:hypothetical protein [Actinomycetota bacterium]